MKYVYILALSVLWNDLSIAVDSSEVQGKRSISTPITEKEFSQLDITTLNEDLQQQAATELLHAISINVKSYYGRNSIGKKTDKEAVKSAEMFGDYYKIFNGKVRFDHHVTKRFISALDQLFKESPDAFSFFFYRPSARNIIGMSYLCCKYFHNSESFLLFALSILETSALEIACAMIDQESKNPVSVTHNNVGYRRWIANESIQNVVKYLRKYARQIFDIYKSNQKISCDMLQKNLFTCESDDEYIKNSANDHVGDKVNCEQIEKKIKVLQDYLTDDGLKTQAAQALLSMKTFLTLVVKEFYIDYKNRANKIIANNRKLLQHQQGLLLIKRMFVTGQSQVTAAEIERMSNILYKSMLGQYCLDKFVVFFNLLDSGNYYKSQNLDAIVKCLQDKEMIYILDVLDSNRASQIVSDLKELERIYGVYCKQVDIVRRLLKEILTEAKSTLLSGESLEARLNSLKLLLQNDAYQRIHLYENQQEIDNQVNYIIKRIADFIEEK